MNIKIKRWANVLFSALILFSATVYSMESDSEAEIDRLRELSKNASLACPDVTKTLPYGYISGLTLVRVENGYGIEVQPGQAISADSVTGSPNGCFMELKQKMHKMINCSGWHDGIGACGLPSPHTFKPNQTYHVFLMMNDSGAVDFGFDTMLDGIYLRDRSQYDFVRRIGSIYTTSDPSNYVIVDFIQYDDRFTLRSPQQVYSANPNDRAVTVQLPTPKDLQLEVIMHARMHYTGDETRYGFVRTIGNVDARDMEATSGTTRPSIMKHVLQNTEGKIEVGTNTTVSTLTATLYGWVDSRN